MQNETSAAGLTASGEVADPAVTDLSSNFGRHGWTVFGCQAVLFWCAAGLATHGLNITLPTLIARYGLDQATLLAWATPAARAMSPVASLMPTMRGFSASAATVSTSGSMTVRRGTL